MIINGVDTDAVPDQFNDFQAGRILILDGDGPAYRVAATVKRLDTAVRNYQQEMLKQMFLTKSMHVRVHLTACDSLKAGRFMVNAVKPYQGQRKGKSKPSLLEPLREAITDSSNWIPEFSVVLHREVEADDGMITEAYMHKENSLIWSDDKDLRMTPYPYWDKERGVVMRSEPFGYVQMKYTPAGTAKCVGQGPLFFWAQMLMGDTADHIQGVLRLNGQKCAAVGAYNALYPMEEAKDINAVANFVLDAYRVIDQNPIPEGYLLWLQRWPGDTVLQYWSELALSNENRRYLNECYTRPWWGSTSPDVIPT